MLLKRGHAIVQANFFGNFAVLGDTPEVEVGKCLADLHDELPYVLHQDLI